MSDSKELKIVLVGDSRCGKTAMLSRYLKSEFVESHIPTGFSTYSTKYEAGDRRMDVTVWDTSGAGEYDAIRPLAYANADVFVLCFEISQPDSLQNAVSKWHPELVAVCARKPVILIGCKSDLRNDINTISELAKKRKITVTYEQGTQISKQIGAKVYIETSARISEASVKEAFDVAVLAAIGKLSDRSSVIQRQRDLVKRVYMSKLDVRGDLRDKAMSCDIM